MTFLSRVTGYVRDAFIAAFIGATYFSDAFFVAFRIPNMLRRLFGEGALTPAVVPIVTDLLSKDEREAKDGIKSIISAASLVVFLITVLGILLSPILVKMMAYGFTKNEIVYTLTVNLTRLMFPYLFFISLVAVYMGILNAKHHFFAPSFSPVLLNLAMIFSLIVLKLFFKLPVFALAYGVLLGGLAQLLFQIPYLKKEHLPVLPSFKIKTEATKAVFTLLIPSIFGMAITQINILVDTFVASFLKTGTVSYLYYADRLLELPIGIFAISFATALLPTISQNAVNNDVESLNSNFSRTLIYCLFFIIPSLFFMICLGKPSLAVLFKRKAFDMGALQGTYFALIGYSLGLPFFTFNRLITPLFYAYKNTKLPVRAGFFAMITNIVMDILLMPLGAFGLSAATSASALVNAFFLHRYFNKFQHRLELTKVKEFTVKILFSSLVAAIPTFILSLHFAYEDNLFMKILYLLMFTALYISFVVIFLILLKTEEVKEIWDFVKKRLLKR
ncbi:MAG: murein biosynthesis integral membrane protein MurJ [bacterium]